MKQTMKRLLAAVLAGVLLLALAACSQETVKPEQHTVTKPQQQADQSDTITLPLAHNDGLNPYTAKSTVNQALMPLLFDGLYQLDEAFEPRPLVAASGAVSGKTVTVALNPAACFSDGSAVTADDVTYSFRKAKNSAYYSARLPGFSSASASADGVTFALSANDPYALSCLNFPIVKQNTAEKDDELPIGCGRYYAEGQLPNTVLKASESALHGAASVREIQLYEVAETDGMPYGLEIGNYDFWYDDLSDGEYRRVNSGVSVVETTNLVYLAFNSEKSIFTEEPVRQAVSVLLSREDLVSAGFQGHATASALPFQPKWSAMENVVSAVSLSGDRDKALNILKAAGYTKINGYGYRASTTKSLATNLVVCKDNAFKRACAAAIKAQLEKINFHVRIIELGYKDYTAAIAKGDFEMYLGEIKLPANMNLSAFFSASGAAHAAVRTEEGTVCQAEYNALRAGELSLQKFCTAFDEQAPFVPLCFRTGLAMTARSIGGTVIATASDGFYSIESWQVK
ncbi:MAG: ABC transporter substrate-binding protein [Clostridia bacterium]|nr:ABC transporter substrate-binding protein [Clostridia bacterium]